MVETIDFKEVFSLIKRRILLILFVACAAAIVSGTISYYVIQPTYQSSTQLLINRSPAPEQTVDMNQIQADLKLVKSYHVMITSPIILDKVISDLNLQTSYEALKNQVYVSSEPDSQIIEVMVEDNNAGAAVLKANTIASIFQKEIVGLMNVDNVSILTKATEAGSIPIQPNPLKNIVIAFAVGMLGGIGLIFFIEYLDRTIKSENEVERLLNLPVLTSISVIDPDKSIYQKLFKDEKSKLKASAVKVGGEKTIES